MKELTTVLEKAWASGFKTKSDFARKYATQVAAAASLGLVTTHLRGFQYGDTWRITKEGLQTLKDIR